MFLLPAILAGLGAVAIPVIIHLLHRQRARPIRWGAMQFLIETPLKSKRRRNVEHWLLMLARMAVLALLVLALARPLMNADLAKPIGGGATTDFAVVLDHSLSTCRAAEGAGEQSVFAHGVELVDRMAGSLRSGDTLAVVLAGHAPKALVDRPVGAGGGDLAALRETLKKTKPGQADANFPDAVAAARKVLGHGRGAYKKIIVLTDDQRTGWQVDNAAAWSAALGRENAAAADANLRVFDLAIPPNAAALNVAVSSLEIKPAVVGPDRPVEVLATVTRTGGGGAVPVPVRFIADGKPVLTQDLTDLAAGASRTVRFEHAFKEAGSHYVQVKADVPDGLAADNTATVAFSVLEKLPVLVIDGQLTAAGALRSSQFLAAAMSPAEGNTLIRPKVVALSDAPQERFGDYVAVIVNDVPTLPAETLARLADYARGGHGVWFILGPRTQPRFVNDQLRAANLLTATVTAPTKLEKDTATIATADANHRSVALLNGAEKNALAGVVATGWWPLKVAATEARPVLTIGSTGDPLMLDRPVGNEGGRVIVWATGADGSWNTLPLAGAFVPLVQETVQYLAGPTVASTYGRRLEAGRAVAWTGPANPQVQAAMLSRPDGAAVPPIKPVSRGGRTSVRYEDTFAPGLYELRFSPTEIPQPIYYSVSIDPRELDAPALSSADVNWLKDNRVIESRVNEGDLPSLMAAPGAGAELWPALAYAMVGLLVVETLITYRMARLQKGAAAVA